MRWMADVLTRAQRRFCMSRIRGKHTGPELVVRHLVHLLGYRYRLHDRNLPGSPDLVFQGRGRVIFVHGCFWHRHCCKLGRPMPAVRRNFWSMKLLKNKQRDRVARRKLRSAEWKVLVVWECQTRDLERLTKKLITFLGDHL
jgi:DNA mismatch endonuclease (patch repair protein)